MIPPTRPTSVPIGFCQCGCGRSSGVYPRTQTMFGHVKGQPKKFLLGHGPKMITPLNPGYELDEKTGCWIWKLGKNKSGYGKMGNKNGAQLAHRVIYEQYKEKIPNGLHLDHLCRNRACVNPDHLEPVTAAENQRRGKEYFKRMGKRLLELEAILDEHGIPHTKFAEEFQKPI